MWESETLADGLAGQSLAENQLWLKGERIEKDEEEEVKEASWLPAADFVGVQYEWEDDSQLKRMQQNLYWGWKAYGLAEALTEIWVMVEAVPQVPGLVLRSSPAVEVVLWRREGRKPLECEKVGCGREGERGVWWGEGEGDQLGVEM